MRVCGGIGFWSPRSTGVYRQKSGERDALLVRVSFSGLRLYRHFTHQGGKVVHFTFLGEEHEPTVFIFLVTLFCLLSFCISRKEREKEK